MGDQEQKAKADRIKRLRERLNDVKPPNATPQVVAVMKGILDLLADEL